MLFVEAREKQEADGALPAYNRLVEGSPPKRKNNKEILLFHDES